MSGHVFVVHGDLTHLACDDWALPSDRALTVTASWLPTLAGDAIVATQGGAPSVRLDLPADWGSPARRVVPVPDALRARPSHPSPLTRGRAWLLDVGTDDRVGADWLVAGVRQFLQAVERSPRPAPVRRGRPLVGLPLVGTGAGGAAARRDQVIEGLLPALTDFARRADVDVALVLRNAADHAAVQDLRRRGGFGAWDLDEPLRQAAQGLAELANHGRLVPFLGAGVSRAAGLPLWLELIEELLDHARVAGPARRSVARLGVLDQAEFVARVLPDGEDELQQWIRQRFATRPHALAHSLLAALPVHESVTTNWDSLFEQAVADTGRRLHVLPYDEPRAGEPWLLKLHGDVGAGSRIVLRRQDYLRFQGDQNALAGVVQSLLFTRHMLFVGFSLVDDNFIRIADQVTRVVDHYAGAQARRMGTTVGLQQDSAKQALWPRLQHLAVAPEGAQDTTEAARLLEVFLDLVSAHVDRAQHYLLDERYAELLDEGDRMLARRLAAVVEDLPVAATTSRTWLRVRDLLADLGLTQAPTRTGEAPHRSTGTPRDLRRSPR